MTSEEGKGADRNRWRDRLTPRRITHSVLRRTNALPLPATPAWTTPADVCVVCPAFPGPDTPYGGQFVQTRTRAYRSAGLRSVVVVSRTDTVHDSLETVDGVAVWRTHPGRLFRYLRKGLARRVVLHHPDAHNWRVVAPLSARLRPLAIFHGVEARPWRLLQSGYSDEELRSLAPELDRRDRERQATLRAVFADPHTLPVFVSKTLQDVAEAFCGQPAPARAAVIHNPVLQSEFPFQPKADKARFRILWVRSFNSHNYANDLSRSVLMRLRGLPGGARFSVTIRGDGPLWDTHTQGLNALDGVDVQRGFVSQPGMAALHADHGVMLVPSRWESQGLTLCEAMSSGLVCATTAVAAVPEFISAAEGLLCPPEDPAAMAAAIAALGDDPARFQRLSHAAAARSAAQCSAAHTVAHEIALLR